MNKARLVPKLRFPEFSDEWQEKKLGDVVKIIMGQSPSSDNYNNLNIGLPLIQGNADCDNRKSKPRYYTNQITKSCDIGDILMSVRAPAGTVFKSFHKACIGRGVCAIKGNDFIYQYLLNYELSWSKFSQGSTFDSLNGNQIKEVLINLPFLIEQTKIADFLTAIDDKIQGLTDKKSLLEKYKKGAMQQIFSQKIRFKADDGSEYGSWVEKKLGDIGKVSMCKRIMKDETLLSGDIPFYKIGTFGKQADAYISNSLYEGYKNKYPFPNKGDILISASGTIGRTVIYDGKPAYFQDSNIVWINNSEQIVKNNFLAHYYKIVQWNTEDTTIARLYNDNLRNINITIPSLPEQTKIANFLTAIDEQVEQISEQLEQTKLYKKSLLQKMFV